MIYSRVVQSKTTAEAASVACSDNSLFKAVYRSTGSG